MVGGLNAYAVASPVQNWIVYKYAVIQDANKYSTDIL